VCCFALLLVEHTKPMKNGLISCTLLSIFVSSPTCDCPPSLTMLATVSLRFCSFLFLFHWHLVYPSDRLLDACKTACDTALLWSVTDKWTVVCLSHYLGTRCMYGSLSLSALFTRCLLYSRLRLISSLFYYMTICILLWFIVFVIHYLSISELYLLFKINMSYQ
jgi:hypothetical protein